MAAPPDGLQQPPAVAVVPRRRPRTRLHFDIVPDGTPGNDDPADFEIHTDVVLSGNGFDEVIALAFRGAVGALVGQGGQDRMAAAIEALARAQQQGHNVAPAHNEVRFTPLPNGNVLCTACTQTIREDEAGQHARNVHGAGQLREEIPMRPVPRADGNLVDPAPAEAPP